MLARLLLAIDSASQRDRIERLIDTSEVLLSSVPVTGRLWEHLTGQDFDLVLIGASVISEPAPRLVREVLELPEHPDVIVLADHEDPAERARLLAAGCVAILYVDLPDDALKEALDTLIRRRREDAIRRLQADRPQERYGLGDFVSASPAMRSFITMAQRLVDADSSLLIQGETGVGKERLARAIHAEGRRSTSPFLAVHCAALPETLLESELFGHEEGAFTGATRSRKGCFELAHRGTIFLDEIGEIPLHLQAKLLRVLEDRGIRRIGGERTIDVDARIMAATNRDLEEEVRAKRFRPDLYYRLSVVSLTIPPLRERREDVPALVESYLQHFRATLGKDVGGVHPEAMEALERHTWPGNVRELINAMERAVLLCPGSEIGLSDLPVSISGVHRMGDATLPTREPEPSGQSLSAGLVEKPFHQAKREAIAAFERAYIARLLESTRGQVGETAEVAGISERALRDLMRRHGLRKESFKRRGRGVRDASR
jgi:DNA-binding NtrC family response regulator